MKDVEKIVDSNGVVMQIVDGAARDMIAAEYDATASYAVGDYCIYNDHYYKCNTAIPSGGETWDATHWDATTLGAEDKEIKQSLYNSTTSDFSLNSNVAGTTYFKYIYKYGNLKMINIAFLAKAISTIDTFYDLFTLPNGYTNIYEIEQLDLTRGKKTIDFKVTNGKVQIAAREEVSLNDLIIVKIDYI